MKKILIICSVFFLFVLSACTDQTEEGIYAQIVVFDGKEYNGTEDRLEDAPDINEKIGTIKKKVPLKEMPGEYESNTFEAGTEIFSVKGTDHYIVMVEENGKKTLLNKVSPKE